jgi:hypothetical protein
LPLVKVAPCFSSQRLNSLLFMDSNINNIVYDVKRE